MSVIFVTIRMPLSFAHLRQWQKPEIPISYLSVTRMVHSPHVQCPEVVLVASRRGKQQTGHFLLFSVIAEPTKDILLLLFQ